MKKTLLLAVSMLLGGAMFAQDAYWSSFDRQKDLEGWNIATTDTSVDQAWYFGKVFEGRELSVAASFMSLGQGLSDAHYLYSPIFAVTEADSTSFIEFDAMTVRLDSNARLRHYSNFTYGAMLFDANGNSTGMYFVEENGTNVGETVKHFKVRLGDLEGLTLTSAAQNVRFFIIHTGVYGLGAAIDSTTSIVAGLMVDDFAFRRRDNAFVARFDANGGTGNMADLVADADSSITVPTTCDFTAPAGKKFVTWFTFIGDEAVELTPESEDQPVVIRGIDEDFVIYAYWEDDPDAPAGIDNAVMNAAKVFPNPAQNMVGVTGVNVKGLEVMDLAGRVLISNNGQNTINISTLANGVYMLRINAAEGFATKKIVKK